MENIVEFVENLPIQSIQKSIEKFCKNDKVKRFFAKTIDSKKTSELIFSIVYNCVKSARIKLKEQGGKL